MQQKANPPASSSSDKDDAKMPSFIDKLLAESDDLNLAGVLNVLDGVVDCPNRIVVSFVPECATRCCHDIAELFGQPRPKK